MYVYSDPTTASDGSLALSGFSNGLPTITVTIVDIPVIGLSPSDMKHFLEVTTQIAPYVEPVVGQPTSAPRASFTPFTIFIVLDNAQSASGDICVAYSDKQREFVVRLSGQTLNVNYDGNNIDVSNSVLDGRVFCSLRFEQYTVECDLWNGYGDEYHHVFTVNSDGTLPFSVYDITCISFSTINDSHPSIVEAEIITSTPNDDYIETTKNFYMDETSPSLESATVILTDFNSTRHDHTATSVILDAPMTINDTWHELQSDMLNSVAVFSSSHTLTSGELSLVPIELTVASTLHELTTGVINIPHIIVCADSIITLFSAEVQMSSEDLLAVADCGHLLSSDSLPQMTGKEGLRYVYPATNRHFAGEVGVIHVSSTIEEVNSGRIDLVSKRCFFNVLRIADSCNELVSSEVWDYIPDCDHLLTSDFVSLQPHLLVSLAINQISSDTARVGFVLRVRDSEHSFFSRDTLAAVDNSHHNHMSSYNNPHYIYRWTL